MHSQVICVKEVELLGEKYIAYLKRVPTKINEGVAEQFAVRAFIKKEPQTEEEFREELL